MIMDGSESWFDEEAGPLVRPFAMTRGRAPSGRHELNMITLVVAIKPDSDAVTLDRESAEIVRMCQRRPLSIAEIAARLDVLLAVAKVLIGDLIDHDFLIFQDPPPPVETPDMDLLQAVLNGLRDL
ncbi:hypothetical protein AHOG_20870 [Actinoalloteichus hoggarensis]|uniref:DUF742 domain-containing protein n=2 Tax=Actinoalloteichus hoggarensis TaxID=1470176 RepID=A0A221W7Z6_9PSEU|nr:hypothetical protein AHOG_20870 [Actinoalloteichus hoggarensis]